MTTFSSIVRCRPDDLGQPIPDDEHAVSVCLPRWSDNVGYEEADPRIIEKMRCGYPRFFLHPAVDDLFKECERRFATVDEGCFAFPTSAVAQRCAEFLRARTGVSANVHEFGWQRIHAVCFPKAIGREAMNFWQHAGEIISSRMSVAALQGTETTDLASDKKAVLRGRVASQLNASPDDVYLFPTGMAAVFMAYRAFQSLFPDRMSVQFGFPYVDNLKIQQRFGLNPESEDGVHLFPNGSAAELAELQSLLATEPIMGLFCEFPGNPLLKSPDLAHLDELATKHAFPMLVDDTLGAITNVDVTPVADVIATSLTKFFSGVGNVAAGALILNCERSFYERLKSFLDREFEDIFFDEDAIILEQNSRDVAERIQIINRNTQTLCDWLREHPAVERVDYPKYQTTENYNSFKTNGGGYGGLFSLQLRNAPQTAPAFYDALEISKGPNLGTNFSLCCPYTILAHYKELDFAESCGISQYLIRVSIGLEESTWIIERFEDALRCAGKS